jgi:hypothetical protein
MVWCSALKSLSMGGQRSQGWIEWDAHEARRSICEEQSSVGGVRWRVGTQQSVPRANWLACKVCRSASGDFDETAVDDHDLRRAVLWAMARQSEEGRETCRGKSGCRLESCGEGKGVWVRLYRQRICTHQVSRAGQGWEQRGQATSRAWWIRGRGEYVKCWHTV